jgi:hypothetical protein
VLICPHGYSYGSIGGGLAFSPDGRTLTVGGSGVVQGDGFRSVHDRLGPEAIEAWVIALPNNVKDWRPVV